MTASHPHGTGVNTGANGESALKRAADSRALQRPFHVRPVLQGGTSAPNPRGIALLTVLVILTVLAIFGAAFVQQVRIQLNTSVHFTHRQIVGDVATSGLALPAEEANNQIYGPDGIPFTGDEERPYLSLLDPWAIGSAGFISTNEPRTLFDTRQWIFSDKLYLEPILRISNGAVWDFRRPDGTLDDIFYANRLGVDEDPPGDLSDGPTPAPGFTGMDDNLDGITDNPGFSLSDDDEDGLTDEDGLDRRADLLLEPIDNRVDSLQMGWDKDHDYVGVEPSTARLNINVAGNTNGPNGPDGLPSHSYDQGSNPGELDLEVFLVGLLGDEIGTQATFKVYGHRYGEDNRPGRGGIDDNNNGDPGITVPDPRNQPLNLNVYVGNGLDDDGDGLTDEEDENLAGLQAYPGPSDLLDNKANRAELLTNGKDDGGIKDVIDDIFEIDDNGFDLPALDDLAENRPRNPYPDASDSGGRDTPFASNDEFARLLVDGDGKPLRLPGAGNPTAAEILDRYITTRSSSPRQRHDNADSTEPLINRLKLNPNLLITEIPISPEGARPTAADFLSLAALDNDGDWGTNTIDPTTGRIILDDKNHNQLPDGDWDGEAEADRSNNIDDDHDGKIDDNGDDNGDSLTAYDPEGHINEDVPTFAGVTSNDATKLKELRTASPDSQNVKRSIYTDASDANQQNWVFGDEIDNNSNSIRWMSDGIDNDGDGLTDESRLEDFRRIRSEHNNIPPEQAWAAADEGVDEIDEWYIQSWDDDKDSTRVMTVPVPPGQGPFPVYRMDEDPIDAPFLANLIDSLDYSLDPNINDGITKIEIPYRKASPIPSGTPGPGGPTPTPTPRTLTVAYGNEAVRITEVMARPLIRLQPENPATEQTQGAGKWIKDGTQYSLADGLTDIGEWKFSGVPKGAYYILVYSRIDRTLGDSRVSVGGTDLDKIVRNEATQSKILGASFTSEFDGGKAYWSKTPTALDNTLTVTITPPSSGAKNLSFDYVELYAPDAQYIELANFGERTINLLGWEFRTGGYNDKNNNGIKDQDEKDATRVTRIKLATSQNKKDLDLAPGRFAVLYRDLKTSDVKDQGPSKIKALAPPDNGKFTVVLTEENRDTANPADQTTLVNSKFGLTLNLYELLFGQDGAKSVEVYAPENAAKLNSPDELRFVPMDIFYFNMAVDFCAPSENEKRQDEVAFAPQHRGDPTASVLRHEVRIDDKGTATKSDDVEIDTDIYCHGPKRVLAEDAFVTFDGLKGTPVPSPSPNLTEANFKASSVAGRALPTPAQSAGSPTPTPTPTTTATSAPTQSSGVDYFTEYGETLFQISGPPGISGTPTPVIPDDKMVTFHWPGVLNQFRNPEKKGQADEFPLLFIRAGGVSPYPIGRMDLDPKLGNDDKDAKERFTTVYHGDLLYVANIDGSNLSKAKTNYADILDLDNDGLRVSIAPLEENPDTHEVPKSYFAYLEISPGRRSQSSSNAIPAGRIAGDPGEESFYFPDPNFKIKNDEPSQFFYMERLRRLVKGGPLVSFQRSLRFREGPMANCSPYLAGAFGRNIEKYSMGRGVFSGPTAIEMQQITDRLDFHPDPQVEGLVNVNCADQKVLLALPFLPPESNQFGDVRARLQFSALMSQVVVMGRSQRGLDGEIGFPDVDDDGDGGIDLGDLGDQDLGDSTFRFPPFWDTRGRATDLNTPLGFGRFGVNDNKIPDPNTGIEADEMAEYRYPGSDDGPYREVGDMAQAFLNPVVLDTLRILNADPGIFGGGGIPGWLKPDKPGGTVPAKAVYDDSDIDIMLGRIANLSTVQSNEFIITTRGRIYNVDTVDGNQVFEQVGEQKVQSEARR
jgi:hypothetical protein